MRRFDAKFTFRANKKLASKNIPKAVGAVMIIRGGDKNRGALTDAFAVVQNPESLVAGADGTAVNFVAYVLAGRLGAHPGRLLLDLTLWHLSDPLTSSAD